MLILTPTELRFELLRGLQELPRSTIRDLSGKPEAREKALAAAADIMAERFRGLVVTRGDRLALDFGDMG
jgi:hypothetical protein